MYRHLIISFFSSKYSGKKDCIIQYNRKYNNTSGGASTTNITFHADKDTNGFLYDRLSYEVRLLNVQRERNNGVKIEGTNGWDE
jgi:hypothetical protein